MTYNSNTQGAGQTSGWGYGLVTSSWDNIMVPNHQTFPSGTEGHYAMPETYLTPTPQGFYSPTYLSMSTDADHMSSVASSTATGMDSENPPYELQVSEEDFTQIKRDIIHYGLVLRMQRQGVHNLVSRKRHSPPDPDPGAANQGDTRSSKKRRMKEGEETGVGQAAQRGETRELPIEGTPSGEKSKSKLRHGLNMEALVVRQGVSSLLALGPTVTGATLGSHEYASQAWTEGTRGESEPQEKVGIEDAHDDEETDKERQARLIRHTDGVWRCAGCGGRAFSDRCTLQRHCKSAMHGKQRDKRKCPFCPKEYQRRGHLTRHMEKKHKGEVNSKEGEGLR